MLKTFTLQVRKQKKKIQIIGDKRYRTEDENSGTTQPSVEIIVRDNLSASACRKHIT